jgi:kynurenine formamidase
MRYAFYALFLALGCVEQGASEVESTGPRAQALSAGVPLPGPDGWGPDDERGNGNTQSYGTRLRCALHLADPQARVYELGRVLSETMPQGPFGDAPASVDYLPTRGIPSTAHAGNGEVFSGGLGSQGTQFDALGHFGFLDAPWSGSGPFPADQVRYYNDFTQAEVKPAADGPLQRLGVDKAPPIITSAVILDAEAYRGRPLEAGERVTKADIVGMLNAQQLKYRGILPGDAVFVHTGWGRLWEDPAADPLNTPYYSEGPGLAVDAQEYLAARTVVLVGLDNPFTDPVRACQLVGACPPPPGSLPGLPFSVHHNNLTQHGIYQMQNLALDELARDGVDLACAMILPLRVAGGAGSAVRPVAVGASRH